MPSQPRSGHPISRRSLLRSTAAAAVVAAAGLRPPLSSLAGGSGKRTGFAQKSSPDFAELDQQIQNAMTALHVPGVAVGLILAGRTYAQGYGVANVNLSLPVDTDTLFQIGSVSKTYTATALMQLVEAGALSLDEPVRRYLPDLHLADERVAADVTPRQLLNHTSDFFGDTTGAPNRNEDALATFVGQMEKLPQLAPLGWTFNYSNAAVMLAGRLLEVVSGHSFEDVVSRSVLAPLNMSRSFYFADQAISYGVAAGHTLKNGQAVLNPDWALPRQANPAGGLASSVTDQLQWLRFHLGQAPDGAQVLSAESLSEMQTVRSPGAPLGYADITGVGVSWLFQRVDGVDFLMHDGGTFGQQSLIMFSPALQFGLVLLANASQALNLINGVSTWVLDHYLGLKDPPLQAVALSPDQLLAYEGRFAGFETPPAKALEFRANGNGLTLTGLDASGTPIGQASQLSLYADDHVFIPSGSSAGLRFDFVRDADGRIGWFRYLGRIVPRLA